MASIGEDEVLAQLLTTVGSITKVKRELTKETNLVEGGVLDSLDFIDYVFRVQQLFGVQISDADLEECKLGNLGNMTQYLMQRMSQ